MAEKMSLDARYAADEYVRLAETLGIKLEVHEELKSEEDLKKVLESVKEKIKAFDATKLPEGITDEQKKLMDDFKAGKETHTSQKEDNPKDAENQSLTIDQKEAVQPTENTDTKWMEEKRNFWQKYAGDHNYLLENNKETDEQNKTCSFSLSKDNQKYDLVYTEPTKAFIGENAPLDLYQGLVQEAAQGNMSITFGEHLSDTQKAMLYAAVLSAGEKGPQMVNPPEIDMNADYFKALPDDVKKVIEDAQKAKENASQRPFTISQEAIEQMNANSNRPMTPEEERLGREISERQARLDAAHPNSGICIKNMPAENTQSDEGKQKIDAMREKLAKHQQLNASRGLPSTALTKPVNVSEINTSALKLMKDQKQAQK